MRLWGLGLVLLSACGGLLAPDDGTSPAGTGGDGGLVYVSPPAKGPSDAATPVDAGKEPTRECPDDTSEPAVLSQDERLIQDLAVDHDWVYWSTLDGNVKRTPRCGGPITELVSRWFWGENRLAVNSTHVYWTSGSEILRVPKGGGAVEDFKAAAGLSFAVDDASLYAFTFTANGLWTYPLDGSAGVALYAGTRSVGAWDPRQRTLATTPTDVYVPLRGQSVTSTNDVLRIPKAGGDPVTVASVPWADVITAMAADESDLYFGDTASRSFSLVRAPLDGSPSERIVSATYTSYVVTSWIDAISLDDTHVYWAEQIDGKTTSLQRMAKSGGHAETLLEKDYPTEDTRESLLVLDDVYAYVSLGDGAIVRVKR